MYGDGREWLGGSCSQRCVYRSGPVRAIPAIQQRGRLNTCIGGASRPGIRRRGSAQRPAARPGHQLGDQDKGAEAGDRHYQGAPVGYGALALFEVAGGRRRPLRLVLVIICCLQQLGVIAVAAFDLDALLVVGAEIDGRAQCDQGAGEQKRADQHIHKTTGNDLR